MDKPLLVRQGPCLEIMRQFPDGAVDCVITDPPYSGFGFGGTAEEYWAFMGPYLEEMWRLCGPRKRLSVSQPTKNVEFVRAALPKNEIVSIDRPFSDGREDTAHFILVNPVRTEGLGFGNWPADVVPASIHPNERDFNKMAAVVQAMSDPGDVVLDPFCGSGALGVAALLMGRKFIGIELVADRARDAYGRLNVAARIAQQAGSSGSAKPS